MRTTSLSQALALLTAAAVLATLTAATVAAPASAAKPKCQGQPATHVGTVLGERIVGTAGPDVIVAKGGNDLIYGKGGNDIICAGGGNDIVFGGRGMDRLWGQLGHDQLYGNAGPDFLAGQVGNDALDGGIGVDKCFQGTGSGSIARCELPVPEPPTLVIAYTDVNTNHAYDTGDVMIAKIVDTAEDGKIGPGDTIKMGQYPTSPNVVKPAQLRDQFEDWKVKTHPVATADLDADVDIVHVQNSLGADFKWTRLSAAQAYEAYWEDNTYESEIRDDKFPGQSNVDWVYTELLSPSQPSGAISAYSDDGVGDDGVIDVYFAPAV